MKGREKKKRYDIVRVFFFKDRQSEEIIKQVLDEIGINLTQELVDTPHQNATAQGSNSKVAQKEGEDLDLQARLDNLRKN